MRLRVLSSDHGDRGPAADALAGAEWDVALLARVPRGGADELAARLGCEHREARAGRWPAARRGLLVALARRDRIIEHRAERAGRGAVHGIRLACGIWCAMAAPGADASAAGRAAREWAAGEPLVLALWGEPPPGFVLAAAAGRARVVVAGAEVGAEADAGAGGAAGAGAGGAADAGAGPAAGAAEATPEGRPLVVCVRTDTLPPASSRAV